MADPNRARDAMEQVRRLIGPRLEQVAGARISGEIPLSESLVNQLIAEGIRRSPPGPVESAQVELRAGAQLAVRVRLRRPRFVPPFVVMLHIEHQPTPESPRLGLRWELAGMAALTAFAAPVLAFLKTERRGVAVEGERIFIDVAQVLRDHGASEMLDYLRSLRVDTRDGALIVAFELRVDERPLQSPA